MSTPHNKVSKDLKNQILERVKTSGKSIAEISEKALEKLLLVI